MIITRKKNYKKIALNLLLTLIIISGVAFASFKYLEGQKNSTTPSNNQSTSEDTEKSVDKASDTKDADIVEVKYTNLTSQTAFEQISNFFIIDTSTDYAKGHLPNSVNYPISDGTFESSIESLDKTKSYLIYSHEDTSSITAAQKLIDKGFTDVKRLEGNYTAWLNGGYPVEIKFNGLGMYEGNVIATRSYLDNKFTLSMTVSGSAPDLGRFFEGWIVNNEKTLSIGKLIQESDKYTLTYTSSEDLRQLSTLIITEETESYGLDGISEIHIFEGNF